MPKEEKKRLWEQLANYIDGLRAQSVSAPKGSRKIKYNHPPEIVALFERLGLRAPKTLRGLMNLQENFVKKIKLLNPPSKTASNKAPLRNPNNKWQPKTGNV